MKIAPSSDSPTPGNASASTSASSTMGSSAAAQATPAETGKAQGSPAAQIITAQASATVALSSAASTLMEGLNEATADFNAEKVSKITQSLADGSFKVNPEAIADKLIANAQEVLSRAQPQ